MANEKRLIDANAAKERIKARLKNDMIIGWLFSIVDDVPTVDAVEVVRCKDCKHSYMGVTNIMCGRCGQNINGIRVGGSSVKEEHFCSYGEMRVEE